MLSTMNLTSITMPQGIKITPGGYVGYVGDVNGDGYTDFLINTYSAAYLIWGRAIGWANIDLNNFDLSQGVKIYLSTTSIGVAIGIGDVNDDDYNDILISIPNGGDLYAGISYLIWGKPTGWTNIDLNNFDFSYGITITGASDLDHSGYIACRLGDINGDGYNDFLIGTTNSLSYLLWGKKTGWSNITLSNFNILDGIKIKGSYNSDSTGYSVSYAGDVNGDGYDDVLIGGATNSFKISIYLLFGKKSSDWQDLDLTTLNPIDGILLQGYGVDSSYFYVNGGGDINKDGYYDFLISLGGQKMSYLFLGKSTNWQNINLTNFNSSDSITIAGASYFYYSGDPVISIGDINKDGYYDFAIGASITTKAGKGIAYVVLGSETPINVYLENFNSSYGITIQDTDTSASINGAGDVNGDGYNDLLIGGSYDDTASKACYLIFGGKIETPSPTINPDHPTTSTTIMPTAPTAPTMPSLPTTPYPTVEHPTIAPTNDTYAGSEPYSESWASSTAGIATIATLSTIFVVGSVALGTWCYYKHKTYDDKSYGLLANELDVLQ